MKLSIRIPLIIGALVLTTAVVVGGSALFIAARVLEQDNRKSLETQALINAEMIQATLDGQLAVLQALANRPVVKTMDFEAIRENLAGEVERLGFLAMCVIYPDGNARYILSDETANLGDRDYFKQVMSGGGAVISEVTVSRVTNSPVVLYAAPITDDAGKAAGVLMGRRDGNVISAFMDRVKTNFNSGYAYLMGTTGALQAHPNVDLVLSSYNAVEEAKTDPSMQSVADFVAYALEQKQGVGFYNFNGKKIVSSFAKVEGYSFTLALAVEENEFTAALAYLRFVILGFGVLFTLIGVGLSIFTGFFVVRPVELADSFLMDVGMKED